MASFYTSAGGAGIDTATFRYFPLWIPGTNSAMLTITGAEFAWDGSSGVASNESYDLITSTDASGLNTGGISLCGSYITPAKSNLSVAIPRFVVPANRYVFFRLLAANTHSGFCYITGFTS